MSDLSVVGSDFGTVGDVQMSDIKTIGLIINSYKPEIVEIGKSIIQQLQGEDIQVTAIGDEAEALHLQPSSEETFKNSVDVVLVIGGDGTMLRAARTVYGKEIPILGINQGYMGFLAEVELHDLQECLWNLLNGNYRIERRMMLTGRVIRNGTCISEANALNDLVITKGSLSRILKMELSLEDQPIEQYHGDGLIFATPTGSTGYSLSAGGPIVYPSIDVCVVSPICQHSLTARPIIFSPHHHLVVKMNNDSAMAVLTVDGQNGVELESGDRIEIHKAQYDSKLIVMKERNFFDVMHGKFRNVQADRDGERK